MTDLNWQWTDDAHTEARAGGLFVKDGRKECADGFWGIGHDELTLPGHWCSTTWLKTEEPRYDMGREWREAAWSFLTWAKSQPVTLEHREGEYVHLSCAGLLIFEDGEWWSASDEPFAVDRPGAEAHVRLCNVISHGFLAPGTITKAPLEIPAVGQWIRATTADGETYEFEVVDDTPDRLGTARIAEKDSGGWFYIKRDENVNSIPGYHVTAWEPIAAPTSPDPTTIRVAVYENGVVMVENRNGDAWVVDGVKAYKSHYDFDKSLEVTSGSRVLALGTFVPKDSSAVER